MSRRLARPGPAAGGLPRVIMAARGSRGTARRPGRHGNSRWSTARLTRAC